MLPPTLVQEEGEGGSNLPKLGRIKQKMKIKNQKNEKNEKMHVSAGASHSQWRCAQWFGSGLVGEQSTRVLWMSCRNGCDFVSRMRRDQSANPVGVWLG